VVSVTELELPVFDFPSPELTGEIYHQRLVELRRQGWLARCPLAYAVLDREAAEFFLRSRAVAFPGREIAQICGVTEGALWDHVDANILNLTGERHRGLRSLVAPAFSVRAADRWRPAMREFLARLWSEVAPATSCEFVTSLAQPYAALTIAAVLGAPAEDAPRLFAWSHGVQRQFDLAAMLRDASGIERAVVEVYDYVENLLRLRAERPSDDLISSLLTATRDGERLSHQECAHLIVNVIAGGGDTTQSQLAHALRVFTEHGEQWALLAQHPELVPRAVREVMRFEPITPFTARLCVEDVEYRDVVFPAGTILAICAERANRECGDGERFDITAEREARPLTFGAGAHYCLGANLARAELEEALAFLAPRLPELALDHAASLGTVDGVYGIDALPLRWSHAPVRAGSPSA
jgi:cytochrome P450